LADRIGARDPGNRPCVNERIPFVYIKTNNQNSLQGDRIENPEYIKENNLTPDYLHYITNQIMKPIIQLYALCIDHLPGYDKDDEYWNNIDLELQGKPMYSDEQRRKNRIQSLKLLAVKELLFDKYINILSEPKIKKISKVKAKSKAKEQLTIQDINCDCDNGDEIISLEKEKLKKQDKTIEPGVLKADVKIVKNIKSGLILAEAYICDGTHKVWRYKKENCKDKTKEYLNIVRKIINYNKDIKYIITINNKKFLTEYSNAVVYYKDLETSKETNILKNMFENQNIGDIKIINYIRLFSDIIEDYKSFTLLAK
jgi:hypothetical protein